MSRKQTNYTTKKLKRYWDYD